MIKEELFKLAATLAIALVFLYLANRLANQADMEQQLNEQLASSGVPTTAIIKKCANASRNGICEAYFDYKVPSGYRAKDEISCQDCEVGKAIPIIYLPESPGRANMAENNRSGSYRTGIIFLRCYAFYILAAFIGGIVSLIKEIKKKSLGK